MINNLMILKCSHIECFEKIYPLPPIIINNDIVYYNIINNNCNNINNNYYTIFNSNNKEIDSINISKNN